MTGCAQVSPEMGSGLQLQACPQGRLCCGGSGGYSSVNWADVCCSRQGSCTACSSARTVEQGIEGWLPLATAGGCGRLLMHWMW